MAHPASEDIERQAAWFPSNRGVRATFWQPWSRRSQRTP